MCSVICWRISYLVQMVIWLVLMDGTPWILTTRLRYFGLKLEKLGVVLRCSATHGMKR